MRTVGTGPQSFLYLNGLATDKVLRLSESVQLLPARTNCSADLFLGLGKSDLDISIISLFLPLVRSQLRVHGSDAKDTAIRSWNAVWDALLLGAAIGTEVMCNLQSDLPAEELIPTSTVVVTNYQLRGSIREPAHVLTENEIDWIARYFASARALLDEDKFKNAIHCLATYHWHSVPAARLAILWSGIEGLFGVDTELVFRISLYSARFLRQDDREEQSKLFAHVKELYKLRSKAVHGGRIKGDAQQAVTTSAELLRSLVFKCVETGALPNIDALVP